MMLPSEMRRDIQQQEEEEERIEGQPSERREEDQSNGEEREEREGQPVEVAKQMATVQYHRVSTRIYQCTVLMYAYIRMVLHLLRRSQSVYH